MIKNFLAVIRMGFCLLFCTTLLAPTIPANASILPASVPARLQTNGGGWENGYSYPGVDGAVFDIVIGANDHVYMGGQFTRVGAIPASCIVEWDGTQFLPMGGSLYGKVMSLAFESGMLYAGGLFSLSSGGTQYSVARWDGTQWLPIGDKLPGGEVTTIEFDHHGNLYVGGISIGM